MPSANQDQAQNLTCTGERGFTCLLVCVGEEELKDMALRDDGVPTHPGHPGLQLLHPGPDEVHLKPA